MNKLQKLTVNALVALTIFTNRIYAVDTDEGWGKYNLFDKLFRGDIVTNQYSAIIWIGIIIYDAFYIACVLFAGYKILEAFIRYRDRAVHPVQKAQALNEILEPLKGLIYIALGSTIIRIIFLMIYPELSALRLIR